MPCDCSSVASPDNVLEDNRLSPYNLDLYYYSLCTQQLQFSTTDSVIPTTGGYHPTSYIQVATDSRRYFQHTHFVPIVGEGKRGAY